MPSESTKPQRARDATTMTEAFQLTVAGCADLPAIVGRDGNPDVSWASYGERVRALSGGLADLGVAHGESVALMLTNRPEFHFFDAAAMHLGAIPHSVYNTYAPEQIEYQLTDAGSRVLVTETVFLERVLAARERLDGLDHVVVVDGDGSNDTLTLADLESRTPAGFDFDAAWRAVAPDDLITLIYTSGTTGPPKGVELTHANLTGLIRSLDDVVGFPVGGRVVSWLPMAHIAERACSHYFPIAFGFATTCCPDPSQVLAHLPEVRPTWFFAPPRIWEKLKGALEAGMGGASPAEAGEEACAAVRKRIGLDDAKIVNIGAAPCPPEVIEFYHALGVPLAEVWGLSEGSGLGTVNPPGKIKIGTVGPPIPGVELTLAGDGEVLLRGPLNMAGYRNQPERTRELIDAHGWLHTGDVGELDDDGYLRIVDRKKELIINAAGKNMSPANIEAKLKSASPLIGQAIAIGDRRPYNVALITLDPDAAAVFAGQHGIEPATVADLAAHAAVVEAVAGGVEAANAQLARVEQIKRFRILSTDWTPDSDELTPTMKLKRKPIAAKYGPEIEALYVAE